MNQLMKALEEVGLNATLEQTGGNIMVAFIQGSKKIIGVDEYTVCVYDLDYEYEEIVLALDDEDITENARIGSLASFAKETFDRFENN